MLVCLSVDSGQNVAESGIVAPIVQRLLDEEVMLTCCQCVYVCVRLMFVSIFLFSLALDVFLAVEQMMTSM